MADTEVKDEVPKQLGRILLKRRPAALVARPRDPATRHAQLLSLSEKYGVPALDLDQVCLKTEDLANVPRELAQHHLLVPVLARPDRLFVAMRDPSQREVIQEVEFVSGKHVYAYAAPPEDIAETIEKAYLARERGDVHFIGQSCPPETLRKAGLLPEEEKAPERVVPFAPPAMELTEVDESPPIFELRLPVSDSSPPDHGPSATVSARPPRLSSLPPALRGRGSERTGELDVFAAVENAFEDLFSEVSTVGLLPTDPEAQRGPQQKAALVVDDDGLNRDVLAGILSDEGYAVRSADNGRKALGMIKERAPDLLLLAAVLPDVNGVEIARRLRKSQRYGNLPIVMIGAVDRGWHAAEEVKGPGDEPCVEKPLDAEDVKQKVAAALRVEHEPPTATAELSEQAERALADGMVAYRSGDIAVAIEHLERGIGIDPLAYRLHLHLGLLFAQQGQIYDAIRALECAVEINARHFAGVKNLAIMYCQAGFRNRAVELWERGLLLAPDEETRLAIQEHLAALLSQEGLS